MRLCASGAWGWGRRVLSAVGVLCVGRRPCGRVGTKLVEQGSAKGADWLDCESRTCLCECVFRLYSMLLARAFSSRWRLI
jgi:hypothetical protein